MGVVEKACASGYKVWAGTRGPLLTFLLQLASLMPKQGDLVPEPDAVAAAGASEADHIPLLRFNVRMSMITLLT